MLAWRVFTYQMPHVTPYQQCKLEMHRGIELLSAILPTTGIGRLLRQYRLIVVYTIGKCSFYYTVTIPVPASDRSLSDHLF